jgi:hypothetical protein
MMFSLEDEILIPDDSLSLINLKLQESERFKGIKILLRGSDEHIATLHVDTPSEASALDEDFSGGMIEEAENSQASYEAVSD